MCFPLESEDAFRGSLAFGVARQIVRRVQLCVWTESSVQNPANPVGAGEEVSEITLLDFMATGMMEVNKLTRRGVVVPVVSAPLLALLVVNDVVSMLPRFFDDDEPNAFISHQRDVLPMTSFFLRLCTQVEFRGEDRD